MSERFRAMTDDDLGAILSALEIAWPSEPDLAPAVMAATRAARPRVVRLPLSRSRRIMLIAAATVLLLAGAALAARFVIDLGAVVVEVTPPGTLPPSTPGPPDAFGSPLTGEEAAALLGDDLALPTSIGRPDRIWADELVTDAGKVVRITAAWEPRRGLPVIAGTTHGAVLMRFEGDTDQAFKEIYEDTGVIEPARIDGTDAIWTSGPHLLQLLTSDGIVFLRVDGNVLIWRDGRYTMRLETALPKADAVRIAASSGTP
jgi:hypothetical protein